MSLKKISNTAGVLLMHSLCLIASLVDRSFGALGTAQSRCSFSASSSATISAIVRLDRRPERACANAYLAAKDQDFLTVGGLLPLQQLQTIVHDLAGSGVFARGHLAL